MESETLATELLRQLKANAKHWFIAFLIVLALWFGTIGAFIWYISLPADTNEIEYSQEATDIQENSTVTQTIGE